MVTRTKALRAEITQLHEEIARLQRENADLAREKNDLQLLMETNIEHSDLVEEELFHDLEAIKQTLLAEITRLREEKDSLAREKTDLEMLIELNIEHSDFIEENLLDKIEATLRESERRFRLVSETIPIPILVTLIADSTILYANEPASRLFDLPLQNLLGYKALDFYEPADRQTLSDILSKQGYLTNYELQMKGAERTARWIVLSAQLLTFNDKPCLLNVLYDITERKHAEEKIQLLNKELERRVEERTTELQEANLALKESLETLKITQEQLIQAEKTVALTGLVAGIAHEINTPVGVGITSSSYLEQKTRELKELYEKGQLTRSDLENYLEIARESTKMTLKNLQRAASQVESFKQVAVDYPESEKKLINVKSYIDDLLLSILPKLKKAQHTITMHCPEDVEIVSYPGAFSQIITHFIINTLIHGFEQKVKGEILLDITRENHILQIRYSDNGKGMTKEERSRIFDAFYTTRRGQGGTGLGLHIVYNLVTQQLKGNIKCESKPGMGTMFIIQIPICSKNY